MVPNRRTLIKAVGSSLVGSTAMIGTATASHEFEYVETRSSGPDYPFDDPKQQLVMAIRDETISNFAAGRRIDSIEALLDDLHDSTLCDIEAYTIHVFDWDEETPYDGEDFDYEDAASIIARDFRDHFGNGVYAFLTDRDSEYSSQGRFSPGDGNDYTADPDYKGNPYTGVKHDDEDVGFALCTTNVGGSSNVETAAHEVGHALLSYDVRSDLYPDTVGYGDEDSNSDHGLAAVLGDGISLQARTIMSTSNPENAFEQVTEGGACDYEGDDLEDEDDLPPREEEMSFCAMDVLNEGLQRAD